MRTNRYTRLILSSYSAWPVVEEFVQVPKFICLLFTQKELYPFNFTEFLSFSWNS